jgi:hypothetical protein
MPTFKVVVIVVVATTAIVVTAGHKTVILTTVSRSADHVMCLQKRGVLYGEICCKRDI